MWCEVMSNYFQQNIEPFLEHGGTNLTFSLESIFLSVYIGNCVYSTGNYILGWGSNFYYWLKLFVCYTHNHLKSTPYEWLSYYHIHYIYHHAAITTILTKPNIQLPCIFTGFVTYLAKKSAPSTQLLHNFCYQGLHPKAILLIAIFCIILISFPW